MRNDSLTIPQGTTWGYRWPVTDKDGADLDLTGWSAKAQARSHYADEDVLYEWSSTEGNISLDDSAVTLYVTPEVSTAWTWTSAVFDIELTDTAGNVARIAQGRFTVSPEVTR